MAKEEYFWTHGFPQYVQSLSQDRQYRFNILDDLLALFFATCFSGMSQFFSICRHLLTWIFIVVQAQIAWRMIRGAGHKKEWPWVSSLQAFTVVRVLNATLSLAYLACTILCVADFALKLEMTRAYTSVPIYEETGYEDDPQRRLAQGMDDGVLNLAHLMLFLSSSLLVSDS